MKRNAPGNMLWVEDTGKQMTRTRVKSIYVRILSAAAGAAAAAEAGRQAVRQTAKKQQVTTSKCQNLQ